MFELKEETSTGKSAPLHIKVGEIIPTDGYLIEPPVFGGFLSPSQIVIYIGDKPYYYFVKKGQSIWVRHYSHSCSLEYMVRQIHDEENEITLQIMNVVGRTGAILCFLDK